MVELVNVSCWAPSADLPELKLIPRLHGLCRMVELVNVSCRAPSADLPESN